MVSMQTAGRKSTHSRKPVTTEEDLYDALVRLAKKDAPEEMYPKGIVDFASSIVNSLPEKLDLERVKCPKYGLSLLTQALRATSSDERQPYHRTLVDFAVRIYEQPYDDVDLQLANNFLIFTLRLEAAFDQVQEGTQWSLVSTPLFETISGKRVRVPRERFTFDFVC